MRIMTSNWSQLSGPSDVFMSQSASQYSQNTLQERGYYVQRNLEVECMSQQTEMSQVTHMRTINETEKADGETPQLSHRRTFNEIDDTDGETPQRSNIL